MEVEPVIALGDSIFRDLCMIRGMDTLFSPGAGIQNLLTMLHIQSFLNSLKLHIRKLSRRAAVILHFDTNNIHNSTPAHIVSLFKQVVSLLLSHNPDIFIFISVILSRPLDFDSTKHIIKDINQSIKLQCQSWGPSPVQVIFLSTFKPFYFAGSYHPQLFKQFYLSGRVDKIHLNYAGVKLFRQFFRQMISRYLNKIPRTRHGCLRCIHRKFNGHFKHQVY